MPDENTSNIDKDSLYVVTSSTRIQILKLLIEKKQLTATDIAKKLGLSKSTVHEHIEKLAAAGLITKSEYSGKKWVYYKPTWRGRDLFPQKDRMQINVVLGLVLMIGVSIALSAVFYVWSAGLASTGGSAPPAFSASVSDAPDNITIYSSSAVKNLAIKTGAQAGITITSGVIVAPRPYMVNGIAKAFAIIYYNTSGGSLNTDTVVTVTYENEAGKLSTAGTVTFPGGAQTGYVLNATLATGDLGVRKVTSTSLNATTLSSSDMFYVNTSAYDTIVKITADNGKPGDITKLTFYIKVGATGNWVKIIPDDTHSYKIGAIVLDNTATDLSWDVGESVYLSETYATGDLAPDTTNPVFVKVIHEPSSSTIYECKTGVNIL
ncbi:MAG: winged helix-turn-helix domain-containing protein [Thermoplasmata archaeon]